MREQIKDKREKRKAFLCRRMPTNNVEDAIKLEKSPFCYPHITRDLGSSMDVKTNKQKKPLGVRYSHGLKVITRQIPYYRSFHFLNHILRMNVALDILIK